MNKLLIFPDKKREDGIEAAQRRWLEQNKIPVVEGVSWKWPVQTWFQARLAKVRLMQV